jgi:hypothetical protein
VPPPKSNTTTVADFYRNGLPGLGWTLTSDNVWDTTVNQTWSQGAQTLTIMASPQDGGGTSVILTLE